jgi:hypothetical protein
MSKVIVLVSACSIEFVRNILINLNWRIVVTASAVGFQVKATEVATTVKKEHVS